MHGAMLASWVIVLQAAWSWWLTVIVTALFSTLFYWCVERPSHQLARYCSQRLAQRDPAASVIEERQVVAEERAS
jgi:peptidoglycan/LPS O-acetylase OafA/YrhL